MKSYRNKKLTGLAILSIALFLATNSAISGTFPFMQRDLGISRETSEFLITLSSIAAVITIALSESVTRILGMKKSVQIGLIMVFISGLIPVIVTNYSSIFVSRIILGAGLGLFNGHSANYISALYEGEKLSSLMGIRNSMEFIGQILLLLVAGFLIKFEWVYGYLAYCLAIIVFFFFTYYVPDVGIKKERSKFRMNKQIFFYVCFAGIMIMNINAILVRLPSIITMNLGLDANINAYMLILPIVGMVSGFLFGYINNILREKTLFLGLILYLVANIFIALSADKMYIFILSMLIISFSQSLCFPYLFAEASRFSRGTTNRIVNNLIFIGCNIGSFISPFFLALAGNLVKTTSLTFAFWAFCPLYLFLFLVVFYEYIKVRSNRS
ncbi:MFS transporter [Anaerococcus sp. AGMB09787]|uniref:MFS transporter n=1 Tax=Anaerococcus sp. AGMB09787 TaxID=2922869 RepID=UPI001FAF36C2|nr:MFS transporter [Anaerococcus sp. AGMB09787]